MIMAEAKKNTGIIKRKISAVWQRGFFDFDIPLFFFGVAVGFAGLMTSLSASATSFSTAWRQVAFSAAGLVIGVILISHIKIKFLANRTLNHLIWLGIVVLLGITAVFGKDPNGSGTNRFIDIGIMMVQPSELVKIMLVMYFSYKIWRYNKEFRTVGFEPGYESIGKPARGVEDFGSFLFRKAGNCLRWVFHKPAFYCALTELIVLVFLVLENHFSAVLIVFLTCLLMAAVAGLRKRTLIIFVVVVLALVSVVYVGMKSHYDSYKESAIAAETAGLEVPKNPTDRAIQMRDEAEENGDGLRAMIYKFEAKAWNRLIPFFDRNEILPDGSFDSDQQPNQALMAIAKGGWRGVGYMNSTQKLGSLYASNNDAIMAIFLEENGIIGFIGIMALIGLMLFRMLQIAAAAEDDYQKMLVVGIFLLMSVQMILHMMINTFMLPYMGVEFPFFSTGGSSTLVAYAELGFVLGVSRGTSIKGFSLSRGGKKRS